MQARILLNNFHDTAPLRAYLYQLTLLKLAGGASKFGGTGEMNFGQEQENDSSNICISLWNKVTLNKK